MNLQIFNHEEHNTKCTRKDTISRSIIMLCINYMYGGTELYRGNENCIFLIRIISLKKAHNFQTGKINNTLNL